MPKNVAIVGATGAVGCLVRRIMDERSFPIESIRFLASKRSAGQMVGFAGQQHEIELLTRDSFEGIDIVIGSTPDDVALEFAPWAIEAGATVVDESGAHRMREDVPLVVPEVNADAITNHQGLIASPNCSTTQMVVALNPLHNAARIRRVVVTTYQAASGAGQGGGVELIESTRACLDQEQFQPSTFAHPLAFNVIPQIGSAGDNGYTSEEMKMVLETQKIFGDESIAICPTCVRVPVANCHSESIVVETEQPIGVDKARELFEAAPGVTVFDDLAAGRYPMPVDCEDRDDVFVGRIRSDLCSENRLAFWCVSDNLRKGAATNAVQIAELLVARPQRQCAI